MKTTELTLAQIVELAHDFDIKITMNMEMERSESKTIGPRSHAIDVKKRLLRLDHYHAGYVDGCADVLHEIVHLIVHPPWLKSADEYPDEAFLLLQFELALARTLLKPRSAAMRGVIEYQSQTQIGEYGDLEVCLWKRPERSSWWRRSVAWLKTWGVLDDDGLPVRKPWPWETVITEPEWRRAMKESLSTIGVRDE